MLDIFYKASLCILSVEHRAVTIKVLLMNESKSLKVLDASDSNLLLTIYVQ